MGYTHYWGYTPTEGDKVRYKDVLICPAVGKLVIGNKALSISKN